jgi:lipoyl(octanoyl) transferase
MVAAVVRHPLTITPIDFGICSLQAGVDLQQTYVDQVTADRSQGFLLMGEHFPVYAVGRSAKAFGARDGAFALPHWHGIPQVAVPRGGGVTYHGPGQLVLYPIVPLKLRQVRPYVTELLTTVQAELKARWGLKTQLSPEISRSNRPDSGLWVKQSSGHCYKLVSIGIGVRQQVAWFGLAINLWVDLSPFFAINPCGFSPGQVIAWPGCGYHEWSMPNAKATLGNAIIVGLTNFL